MYLRNKIYVSLVIVDTTPELCQKDEFSLEKRMKCIFVYVLGFMLTLDKMQNNSTSM